MSWARRTALRMMQLEEPPSVTTDEREEQRRQIAKELRSHQAFWPLLKGMISEIAADYANICIRGTKMSEMFRAQGGLEALERLLGFFEEEA